MLLSRWPSGPASRPSGLMVPSGNHILTSEEQFLVWCFCPWLGSLYGNDTQASCLLLTGESVPPGLPSCCLVIGAFGPHPAGNLPLPCLGTQRWHGCLGRVGDQPPDIRLVGNEQRSLRSPRAAPLLPCRVTVWGTPVTSPQLRRTLVGAVGRGCGVPPPWAEAPDVARGASCRWLHSLSHPSHGPRHVTLTSLSTGGGCCDLCSQLALSPGTPPGGPGGVRASSPGLTFPAEPQACMNLHLSARDHAHPPLSPGRLHGPADGPVTPGFHSGRSLLQRLPKRSGSSLMSLPPPPQKSLLPG